MFLDFESMDLSPFFARSRKFCTTRLPTSVGSVPAGHSPQNGSDVGAMTAASAGAVAGPGVGVAAAVAGMVVSPCTFAAWHPSDKPTIATAMHKSDFVRQFFIPSPLDL